MLQITVAEGHVFELEKKEGEVFLNGKKLDWDLSKINERHYHVISEGQSFNLEIVEKDLQSKEFVLKINGKTLTVVAKDKLDLLLENLGMAQGSNKVVSELVAPMPGLIMEVCVEEGSEVKIGDKLIVLEAMKMENVLKSPVDGVVKSVSVGKGDNVEKKHVLIHFE
ncbi:biotin/lipoyl-containing protein [Flammeovirgaceae bacterium SG7u.111]|nr:biotin/lipoyl-containing protein [Flammeovirgaceae bacterium SG7u.132]WPO37707.1 biotin/lipoyl-containing protein [Flammeovirgaceae bacterium SG7u.111]